jgi:hypothetical protein
MPYVPPSFSASNDVLLRVVATAWRKHLTCRVRRCRRENCCTGRKHHYGSPMCMTTMPENETEAMFDYFASTIQVATPQLLAACLAEAKTDEERADIEFRRQVFLYYHSELAFAGLAGPLGSPFVED